MEAVLCVQTPCQQIRWNDIPVFVKAIATKDRWGSAVAGSEGRGREGCLWYGRVTLFTSTVSPALVCRSTNIPTHMRWPKCPQDIVIVCSPLANTNTWHSDGYFSLGRIHSQSPCALDVVVLAELPLLVCLRLESQPRLELQARVLPNDDPTNTTSLHQHPHAALAPPSFCQNRSRCSYLQTEICVAISPQSLFTAVYSQHSMSQIAMRPVLLN